MNKRKEKQKNKKSLCLQAESLERETNKLVNTAKAVARKEWAESVKNAGGAENMRLNAKPPKCRKKSPPSFKTVDRRPWVTIVEDGRDRLVKLNRVSFRQGLQSNLPSYGFTYVLGKWGKLS